MAPLRGSRTLRGCLAVLAIAHARGFSLGPSLPVSACGLLTRAPALSPRLRGAPLRLRAAEVTPDVAAVLTRYGVPATDHPALVKELAPLLAGGEKPGVQRVETLDVTLERGAEGGLGIDVDKSNVIQGNKFQRGLQVGDRVVAIDGVRLGSKFVAQALEPGKASYVFTVERGGQGAAAIEDEIFALAKSEEVLLGDSGLSAQKASGKVAESFVKKAQGLEALGASIDEEKLKGFWKLCFTSDPSFVSRGGASGLGALPYCYLAAHYQCYQDKAPSGQTVEIVANTNLGSHAVGALKGAWKVDAESKADEFVSRTVTEAYERTEFANALQSTKPVQRTQTLTFVGDKVRISRGEGAGADAVYVYLRLTPEKVSEEIGGWVQRAVPGASLQKARWEEGFREEGPGASTLGN